MRELPFIALIVAVLAGVYGYVMNVISLSDAYSFGGMEAARVAGCFIPPLGAVLGYF